MKSEGWEAIGETWPSCYDHPQLQLFLAVYVDDFKMSGPKQNMKEGWTKIRTGLNIETEKDMGMYLGCNIKRKTMTLPTGEIVTTVEYDM